MGAYRLRLRAGFRPRPYHACVKKGRRKRLKLWVRSLGLGVADDMLVTEQFRLVAKQIPILYSVIIVNCFFMAVLASMQASPFLAFAFPAAAVPMMLFRIASWRPQAKRLMDTDNVAGMRKALRITTAMANVMAMVLAAWSIALLITVAPSKAAFVPVFTILSMITCAYCLSAYPIAAYSVMLSGSTYIALAMIWTGDRVLIAMALNIGLVSIMVIHMARHQYGQLRRLVRSGDKLKRQSGQARQLAYQDQLTGLPNRRALIMHMRRPLAARDRAAAGLIMIDLNGFKPVNDTFGHPAGDLLLVTISERLLATVDRAGFVSRLGGDEFCVFLPTVESVEDATGLAEAINVAIRQPLVLEGHMLHLGAAIGVAVVPRLSSNPLGLLQRADIALYHAKSSGSDGVSLFEDQMEARVKRRTLIEHALADPHQIDALRLQYQPIFTLRTNRMIGYEALARWEHPVLGAISPAEFIEVAERSGKARALTLHLFRQAIEEARRWPDDLFLSFNLSGSGLCTAGFEDALPEIIDEMDFAATRLILEVTETALLADPLAAWDVLRKLKQRGVRITLDDFGAGHASIGYLRDIRLDGVKLDGSLIRDITTNPRSRKLLMGVLQLCRSIGVSVTAEQVETLEQLSALQAFPIDNVQGFLLGKPCDIEGEPEAPLLKAGNAG